MTPTSFRSWRKRLQLNISAAARALHINRETIRLWENGTNPVPYMAALACAALEAGIGPCK